MVVHNVIFDAFPCSSLVHEVLHYAFSSTECSVMYAGFLVRVLFEVYLVWQFGPAFLCHVLIVGNFRYMRVYMASLHIMHWVTIHSLWFVYKCLCD